MGKELERQEEHELAVIEAVRRPPRADIILILGDRVAGAKEIAEELGEPVGKVRRHLRALLAAGLIETETTKTRRGAMEKYFLLASRGFIGEERFAELNPDMRRRVANYFLKAIVADLGRAARTESTFEQRVPSAVRVRLELDEEGWRELVGIGLEILARVEALRDEVAARPEARGMETIAVSVSIIGLELSPRSSGDLPRARRRQQPSVAPPEGESSTRREELAFIGALQDPARASILLLLTDRIAGVTEIAEALGRPPSEIREHLRVLLSSGLIKAESADPRRGIAEQYLVIDSRLSIGEERFAELTPHLRSLLLNHYLKMISGDIANAIRSGTTQGPHEPLMVRVRMALEDRDWPALERIVDEATERIEALKHEVAERLDEQGGEAITASAILTALELRPPSVGEIPKRPFDV